MKPSSNNPQAFAGSSRGPDEFLPKVASPNIDNDSDLAQAHQAIANSFEDPTVMLGGSFSPRPQLNCDPKQEFDIYFAAALTGSGKLTERQLAKVISN